MKSLDKMGYIGDVTLLILHSTSIIMFFFKGKLSFIFKRDKNLSE